MNDQSVQRIDVCVHSRDWARLKANFDLNTYYPAGVWWRGQAARNAACAHAAVGRDWTDCSAQVIPYYFPYVGSDPSACAAFFKPVTHLVLTVMALPASRIVGAGASSGKRQDDSAGTRRSRAGVSPRGGSRARRGERRAIMRSRDRPY